jgi:hypothetical protein
MAALVELLAERAEERRARAQVRWEMIGYD